MLSSTIAQASIQANTHAPAEMTTQQAHLAPITPQAAQRVKQLTIAFSAVQKALQKVVSKKLAIVAFHMASAVL